MTPTQPFFGPYDLLLFVVGAALMFTLLGNAILDRLNLSKTFIYIAVGALAGPLLLDLAPDDPLDAIPVLERVSELGVILSLIVIGIRIGRPISWRGWRSTMRLILIVMPLTIVAVALTGYWMFGLALGPAILLGAILAPTDLILAGPLEEHSLEDESEDRFGLSSKAGLNDGFAFPFVYLGVYTTLHLDEWERWIVDWALMDLLYAVAVVLPVGWVIGYFSGRLFHTQENRDAISHKRALFMPLAVLLLVYGLVEAIGAYGFLAAFTAGLGFRRALDDEKEMLEGFAKFTDAIDNLAKAVVLIMVGSLLRWEDFAAMGWSLLGFALLLIIVSRPVITMAATAMGDFKIMDRVYWSWFGIRGIGSIYYLSYALDSGIEGPVARGLFTITVATILISSLLHGISFRPFLHRFVPGVSTEE